LLEKLDKKYSVDKQDISLNELSIIKNDIESSFYRFKEFVQKHDLTYINYNSKSRYNKFNKLIQENDLESIINNVETQINEITELLNSNPLKFEPDIEGLRLLIATILFPLVLLPILLYACAWAPLAAIFGLYFISTGEIDPEIFSFVLVISLPIILLLTLVKIMESEGKISCIEAWQQIVPPLEN